MTSATTSHDPQYEQFLHFQRMQWEQLKEFQQLHSSSPSAASPPKPTFSTQSTTPARAHAPPSRPTPTVSRCSVPQRMASPKLQPEVQQARPGSMFPRAERSGAQPIPRQEPPQQKCNGLEQFLNALLSSELRRQNDPSSVETRKVSPLRSPLHQAAAPRASPPSSRTSLAEPSRSASPASRPSSPLGKPDASRVPSPASQQTHRPDSPVTGAAGPAPTSRPPSPPAKPSPLERFESVSNELDSLEEKLTSGCDYTQLQGQLMRTLLELDQVDCPALLRPVRKSLVSRANTLLDQLEASRPASPSSGSVDTASVETDDAEGEEQVHSSSEESENLTAAINESMGADEEDSAESLDPAEVVTVETVTPGGPEVNDSKRSDSSIDESPESAIEDYSDLADSLCDLFPTPAPELAAA